MNCRKFLEWSPKIKAAGGWEMFPSIFEAFKEERIETKEQMKTVEQASSPPQKYNVIKTTESNR